MSAIKEHFHDKIEAGMHIEKHTTLTNMPIVQINKKNREISASKNQPINRNPVT